MRSRAPLLWPTGLGLPVVAAALVLLPGLGGLDLWAPDEPRYAQVAEEMRSFEHDARGLVLLHLNGEAYSQKPPLYYWLAAAFGSPFGHVGHWAARLPAALAGIAVVGLTGLFGRRLFTRSQVGVIASLVLLGVLRFAHQARRAQLDVILALCELSALLAFWLIDRPESRHERSRIGPLVWLHGSIALGLLTKGPVAALPYAIIIVFLLWERRRDDLRRIFPFWGLVLAVGPAGAWLVASAALAPTGFFHDAVTQNLLQRFFSVAHHARPIYYFFYQLPLDFLPWAPVALVATGAAALSLRSATDRSSTDGRSRRFLLTWLATFLVFFSLSMEKRGLYLLPAFPALALLSADWLSRSLDRRALPPWLSGGAILFLSVLALCGLLGLLGFGQGLMPALGSVQLPKLLFLMIAGVAGFSAAMLGWARWRMSNVQLELATLLLAPILLECVILLVFLPALNSEKSPRFVAEVVSEATTSDARVGVYRHSALSGGIEYYSGRRTVALENSEALQEFLSAGGRIIVARVRDEPQLRSLSGGRIISQLREGR
ncbi:MAG: glycosyltransferase family 39 protein, partial [Myxococcota bacterium]